MKRVIVVTLYLGLLATAVHAEELFKTRNEKLGYAIGMNLGITMKATNVTADADQIAAGLKAALKGEPTLMSVAEMGQILKAYREEVQELQKQQMEKMTSAADETLKKSQDFLAGNAKQPEVVTLASGLQYKVLTSGKGTSSPRADAKVEVHYRGTLIDGTEFDSSYAFGEPVITPVNKVIAGWTEALQLMKEGDKWQLVVPPGLAYGEKGAPPVVPPNAALVYELELLKILE